LLPSTQEKVNPMRAISLSQTQWVVLAHKKVFFLILKLELLALLFPKLGMESKVGMKKSNLVIIRIPPLVLDLLCGDVRKIMTSCVILSKGLTNNLQN